MKCWGEQLRPACRSLGSGREDRRWKFGVPPTGNTNFAWVQHMIHHLAPAGLAGFVLANGSMSANQHVVDREMRLTDAGRMVVAEWQMWPQRFPNVQLDAFVVMPNHVPAIIVITADPCGVGAGHHYVAVCGSAIITNT